MKLSQTLPPIPAILGDNLVPRAFPFEIGNGTSPNFKGKSPGNEVAWMTAHAQSYQVTFMAPKYRSLDAP